MGPPFPENVHRSMINAMGQICNGLWHGPNLTILHWACLRSFIEFGHTFRLYTYRQLHVPTGVILMNAAEIIAENEVFYFNNPANGAPDLGPFSDLFRFKLL